MRIYVGGLGETVREADIHNTFSKLGAVESVEFVRTKGRSFAYIDFLPSSDNSVAKLFSTYNGCAWKGGRLRLEKAKEHYLERMRREWAEDAELAYKARDGDDDKKAVSSGDEEVLDETSQIRMYLPRLRKVRPLPYKGTGKHKYSFQRLQAPSRAVHFCDCVEHAVDFNTASATEGGGMNEDEVNMMNSVLSKFLEREPRQAASSTSSQAVPRTRENQSTAPGVCTQQVHEDDSADDDNIIINAVARPNDMSHLLESMKKQTGLHTKMARPNWLRTSADVHSWNDVGIQRGKGKFSREKGRQFQVEGNGEELEFSIPNRKRAKINQSERMPLSGSKNFNGNKLQQRGHVIEKDDTLALLPPPVHGGVSDSEAHHESAAAADAVDLGKVITESPPEQLNEVTNADPKHTTSEQADKGASCSQKKSSWMRLVGSASSSPFTISQILPETEKSKKGAQSSSAQINGISYPKNPSALKRKRENREGDLDSGKEGWVVASTSECFNMRGFGKK